MLRLQNVSLVRGVRVLYKNVNLTTSDGEIIGLVGPNGSGKSTLFAAILGELSTEDGDILAPPLNRISHVAQRVVETDLPALEYILEGHAPLMEAKAELKRAEEAGDDMAYAQAVAHLAEINEGAVVAKAEEILYGLGFKPNDSSRQVSEFSGGWRNRIALARALMRPADLLLLDEPTNHLDIAAREWIEEAVEAYDGTLLFVSHDRYFINRFATRIWEVADGTITDYPMGFTQYRQVKAQEAAEKQETQKPVKEKTNTERPARGDRAQQAAKKQLTICEREIAKAEEKIAALDAEMEANACDYEKLNTLVADKDAAQAELDALYQRWEELSEAAGEV